MRFLCVMQQLIRDTENFVRQTLQHAEGGHDWWHIYRVWQNARLIGATEPVDMLVVELAALLHDIADPKFHDGDEEIGPKTAVAFLESKGLAPDIIRHIELIIRNMSFKNSLDGDPEFHSPELAVVQDADRLDAIGAIGIARTFNYGGFRNRPLYDPAIPPETQLTKAAYKSSTAPTLNHFYEKLLLLKDRINTPTARQIAKQRHTFMEQFLEQFLAEWDGRR